MELVKKSEWFSFPSPIGEPSLNWTEPEYYIERMVLADGAIAWYGQNTNWVKEKEASGWAYLVGNVFVPCEVPIYEQLYLKLVDPVVRSLDAQNTSIH